jgi:predicted porin
MKKQLLAAAALALVSGVAAAQSATVYGVLDVGVFTTNNSGGKNLTSEATGQWFPSLFGITGSEDLGGGNKASFNLQGSLGLTNGTNSESGQVATGLFGREATVSLSSASMGSVRLGRQIDNLFLQSFINGVISTHANSLAVNGLLLSGQTNSNITVAGAFLNNAVEYSTPTVNGLTGKVQYVIGGQAGSNSTASAYNGLATYASGSLLVSAGYEQLNDSLQTVNGVANTNVGNETKTLLGAKYSLGNGVDLAAQYNNWKVAGVTTNAYEVGAAYHVSPAFLVGLNYESFNKTGYSNMTVTSLKAKYDLSKRTYLFAMAAEYNQPAAANISQGYAAATGSATGTATNFNVGVVHAF